MVRSISLATGAVLAGALLMGTANSQNATPNFAPNPNVGWVAMSGEFIAPPSGPGPVKRDPAHPRVTNDDLRARGEQPTFAMGDVNSPLLQPWAREVLRKRNELVMSGKPAFPRNASCYPAGVPAFLLYPVQPVYFVQAPKEVVMIWQADHQVRHVFLADKHSPQVKTSWYGESIGHYEGDTLVVDTVGLDDRSVVDGFQTPHTKQLHVVERFRLIEEGKGLEANIRVEDPGAFTTPWNASQRFRQYEAAVRKMPIERIAQLASQPEGPMQEQICADNPRSFFAGQGALQVPQAVAPDF
jgi:hypothetical protein